MANYTKTCHCWEMVGSPPPNYFQWNAFLLAYSTVKMQINKGCFLRIGLLKYLLMKLDFQIGEWWNLNPSSVSSWWKCSCAAKWHKCPWQWFPHWHRGDLLYQRNHLSTGEHWNHTSTRITETEDYSHQQLLIFLGPTGQICFAHCGPAVHCK